MHVSLDNIPSSVPTMERVFATAEPEDTSPPQGCRPPYTFKHTTTHIHRQPPSRTLYWRSIWNTFIHTAIHLPRSQVDVSNAFLHGFLNVDVYMQQPPDFEYARFPRHVCKVQYVFYGLKQSPRALLCPVECTPSSSWFCLVQGWSYVRAQLGYGPPRHEVSVAEQLSSGQHGGSSWTLRPATELSPYS